MTSRTPGPGRIGPLDPRPSHASGPGVSRLPLGRHQMPHLNGTLLDHLLATEELLRSWGSSEEPLPGRALPRHLRHRRLRSLPACPSTTATSCAAVAGRRGRGDRLPLRLVRPVRRLSAAGRGRTRPLPGPFPPADRSTVTDDQLRDFVDLTLANELEIAGHAGGATGPPAWIGPLVGADGAAGQPRGAPRGASLARPRAVTGSDGDPSGLPGSWDGDPLRRRAGDRAPGW